MSALLVVLALPLLTASCGSQKTTTTTPPTTSTYYAPQPTTATAVEPLPASERAAVAKTLRALCQGRTLSRFLVTPIGTGLLHAAPGPAVVSRFSAEADAYAKATASMQAGQATRAFGPYLSARIRVVSDLRRVERDLETKDLAHLHLDLGLLRQDDKAARARAHEAGLKACLKD